MDGKRMILIIDDETDLLDMLKFQLEKKNYKVVTAKNGVEGLEKLGYLQPDLIILDMNMPKMSGIEFYNEICQADGKPPFPILVLTARASLEPLFKEIEVDGFMPKPFEIDQLLKEIERILAKSKASVAEALQACTVAREVLIADDDAKALKEIATAFLQAGYRVNTAKGGAAAIERINGNIPDVVVMRWEMEDISGDTVVIHAKKMPHISMVKFLLYTDKASDNLAIMDEIRRHTGIEEFVVSSRPQELLSAVEQALKTEEERE